MFQKTIVTKYLKTQNPDNLALKWDLFKKHFHNPEIQVNIRQSKEEQYQGEFLIDLFVNILGYTKNPTPNYNLTTEYKNVKDSKKADGAIVINSSVTAIIELKGTKTTDLSKIEDQAFGYKNNQRDCKYIITSNFEKLRFYIDNAIENLEFNLFQLTFEQFQLLYLCLAYENIAGGIPKKIKAESLSQEDVITKKLYKDYSVFKSELFDNLTVLNPNYEPLELFKKSQKLLDRFLFLFFGEDRGLLPPNSVRLILEDWTEIRDRDEDVKLYGRFKKYFGYLNTGFKGKRYDVFAYNGGLFKTDEILDAIKIDDELLYKHTLKLADYDFDSEVDVNILGHIFENSLNELDEIKAQLEGQEIDKSKTKRKKDGVFYTPKYITKYIVENTVGKLCEDKKGEFLILEEDYFTDKKRQQKTKAALLKKLDDYRAWLHKITIIDPACGSGAFLNEALNFLIEEHQYIDELEAKLTGSSIAFTYHSESILENNLFGVDLNEESVEIAKLSLWLRTAEPNRKLNSLTDNIKCGNSLINDPEVAGDKAFNWEQEFPQIFAEGGFDVVIGNPPYVRIQNLKTADIDYYFRNYKAPSGKIDISILFFEKSISLINPTGLISFISSSQWMKTNYGKNLRNIMLKGFLKEIVDFGSLPVFDDADTYPAIFNLSRICSDTFMYKQIFKRENLNTNSINSAETNIMSIANFTIDSWNFNKFELVSNLESKKINFQFLEYFGKAYIGVLTGLDKAFVIDKNTVSKFNLEKDILLPYAYRGNEIEKYSLVTPLSYVIYPYSKGENGTSLLLSEAELREKFPNTFSYLSSFKEELMKRKDSRKHYATGEQWFRHLRAGNFNYITTRKLIFKGVETEMKVGFLVENTAFNGANSPAIIFENSNIQEGAFLALLNSKLCTYYLNSICPQKLGGYYRYNATNVSKFPVPLLINEFQEFLVELADQMLSLNKELQEISAKFQRTCERKFENLNSPKKLQDWYKLYYADFVKELTKQKIKLTLSEEAEWADYFDQEKNKALEIQSKIESTDKKIDQMVYELYGLSEEEIGIVDIS